MTKQRRQAGDVVVAANGYSYTYVPGDNDKPKRVLTHWLVAEKKYGRPPNAEEQVRFEDGNRKNLHPDNIVYVSKANPVSALKRRRSTLIDRIREYEEELREVEKKLVEAGVRL